MKTSFIIIALLFTSSLIAQKSLRDSLYGGKLKADTGRTFVSTDTSKYVPSAPVKNATISSEPGEKKKGDNKAEINKLDDATMPDSLNKLYYSKQRLWKKFIENNTQIISQQANDTRKVKKGEYTIEIEYEIGLNGRITTKGITCSPANEFLTEQVTELMKRTPVLSAPVYNDGKPRAISANQPITIIKK